jgi:hypothetical protein
VKKLRTLDKVFDLGTADPLMGFGAITSHLCGAGCGCRVIVAEALAMSDGAIFKFAIGADPACF